MAGKELKTVLGHGRVYGLGSVVNRGAGFLLLPLYTHVLTPEEYGIYALIVLAGDLFGVLLGMGLGRALVRYYVEAETEERQKVVVSTAFLTLILICLLALALTPLFAYATVWIMFGTSEHFWLFCIGLLGIIFGCLLQMQLSLIMAQKRSWFYFWVSTGKAALLIGLSLAFLLLFDLALPGVVWATTIASAALAVFLLVRFLAWSGFGFDRASFHGLVRFGAPLVPAVLLDTALASLDRYVLNRGAGPEAVGAYALGLKLAGALRMFVGLPFVQIWGVRRMEAADRIEIAAERELADVFVWFLAAFTGAALAVALFAPEVVAIVAAASYAEAAHALPFLAMAQVLAIVQVNFEVEVHVAKKTVYQTLASGLTLALAIPIFWLLVPTWGLLGASIGAVAAQALRTALIAGLACRVSPKAAAFPWSRTAPIFCLAVAIWAVADQAFGSSITPETVVAKAALLACFCVGLLFSPVFGTSGARADAAHAAVETEAVSREGTLAGGPAFAPARIEAAAPVPSMPTLSPLALLGRRRPMPAPLRRATFWYCARTALAQAIVCLHLRPGDAVALPAFCCGSEIDVFLAHGMVGRFYAVGRDLAPDRESFARAVAGARAALVTHFFGVPVPLAPLRDTCRRVGAVLIEDCAHALYAQSEEGPVGTLGDAAVFSLWKTVALPDGGALVLRPDLPPPTARPRPLARESVATLRHRLAEWLRTHPSRTVRTIEATRARVRGSPSDAPHSMMRARGDEDTRVRFRPELVDAAMSPLSVRLFNSTDGERIRALRQQRYREIDVAVRKLPGLEPLFARLPEDACPLYYPVMVENGASLRRALETARVGTKYVWPWFHPSVPWDDFQFERRLKETLLGFPVHQSLRDDQVERLVATVRTWAMRSPPNGRGVVR